MKRRRRTGRSPRSDGNAVSLFPFLAVLISTMGALILLLVVISQHTKTIAAQDHEKQIAGALDDIERVEGIVRFQVEAARKSHEDARRKLAETRLKLGQIESHIRELREKATQFRQAIEALEATGDDGLREQGRLETQLAEVQAAIERKARELEETRRKAVARPPRYAIIPFDGRNRTRRRPVYLECTASGVILQPEGVRIIGAEDLPFLTSPGNALDRVLRAFREHLADRAGDAAFDRGEPYPLLVIRPSGIESFYLARTAMQSWNAEFGYELVDEEMELEYPAPDAELRRTVAAIVSETRAAQRQVVALLPVSQQMRALSAANQTGGPPQRYTASPVPGGGIVRQTPDFESLHREAVRGGPHSQGGGRGDAPGLHFEQTLGPPPDRPAYEYGPPSLLSDGHAPGGYAGNTQGGPDASRGPGGGPSIGVGRPEGPWLTKPDGATREPGSAVGRSGDHVSRPSGGDAPDATARAGSGTPPWSGQGGAPLGVSGPPQDAFAASIHASGDGTGTSTAGAEGTPASSMPGAVGATAGATAGTSAGAPCSGGDCQSPPALDIDLGAPPDVFGSSESPPSSVGLSATSLAQLRGENWALPQGMGRLGNVSRPIRVECFADRLVVVPERGLAGGRTIALAGPLRTSIDAFVTALWAQIEQWGSAGRGMRWRPVLSVHVMPGGRRRFEELQTLLSGSGLAVEAASEPDVAHRVR